MRPIEKLRVLFSPLDYVIVTKKFEYLVHKDTDAVDLPPNFLFNAFAIASISGMPVIFLIAILYFPYVILFYIKQLHCFYNSCLSVLT